MKWKKSELIFFPDMTLGSMISFFLKLYWYVCWENFQKSNRRNAFRTSLDLTCQNYHCQDLKKYDFADNRIFLEWNSNGKKVSLYFFPTSPWGVWYLFSWSSIEMFAEKTFKNQIDVMHFDPQSTSLDLTCQKYQCKHFKT